ncbi:hypothetical protein [Metabacillus bambusae]|uniref:Uncharacterized protein n=1 Tax=Metabacillus bambusae TaxID=2795218 RepID=A0ABS3MWH3_9BACI|nr:hypothetical protein [Metabacillus bambusae]MBO1510176.1 hypothetical protein [Metabacillus bambusae]
MKNNKHFLLRLPLLALISFLILSIAAFVVKDKKKISSRLETSKYPIPILTVIKKSLGVSSSSGEYDHIINGMSKIDVLKQYIEQVEIPITGMLFREAVYHVFGLNLNKISDDGEGAKLSIYSDEIMEGLRQALNIKNHTTESNKTIMSLKKAEVMDLFLKKYNIDTYEEMIRIVNLIYGINLPGISSLEDSRISLYSKNQWLLQKDTNLFVVYTGKGDIDVKVYPTPYYIKQTGLTVLPQELQKALLNLGFRFDVEKEAYYYQNPSGETVSDSFKGQTLNAIRAVVGNMMVD